MANFIVVDGAGTTKYVAGTGAGTNVDPFIPQHQRVSWGNVVPLVLTVSNGVYSINDVVGGLLTFPNAVRVAGGKSQVVSCVLNGVAALAYNLFFLNADLATPVIDNGIFTNVVADMPKMLGNLSIAAADYKPAAAGFNMAAVKNVRLMVQATVTTIYAYLVAVAVTSPGTTRLDLSVGFEYMD